MRAAHGGSDDHPRTWLTLRSLLWTILFPGFFAGYVPWRYFDVDSAVRRATAASIPGLVIVAAGVALLAMCIFEFAHTGRGTLSPADPPRHLVTRGLYRYVRNPMYLSVALILSGEALLVRSLPLTLYLAVWFLIVNAFVLAYEEPALQGQFGAEYDEYRRRVPRWSPHIPRSDG